MASIQGIYIALFGRPADPLGLDFFNEATGDGADLTAIGDLAATAEYQSRFEGMDNAAIVTEIYNSLFGRNPEQAGLAFFVNALNAGTLNINNVAIAILDGAQGDDLATVNNKITAAEAFTAAIDTADELAAYRGDAAAASGRDFLDGITSDEATIPTAAQTDAAVAGLIGNNPGTEFILTDAVGEQVNGTEANDTITGVVDTAAGTLNVGDVVDGKGGTDTANLLVTAASTIPAGATIKNVEIINITHAGASGALGLNSSSFAGVQQLWQIDNTVGTEDFQDLTVGTGVVAGFRSTGDASAVAAAATVTAASGVTSVSAAVDGVLHNAALTFAETTAAELSAVSVSGSVVTVAGNNWLNLTATATDVDSLKLDLTSNTTVLLTGFDDLNTVDASGSTGNLTLDLGAPDELTSAKFGSGGDTVTLDTSALAAGTTAIDTGAGNDIVNLTAAGNAADTLVNITLGAGSDTIAIYGATNVTAEATFAADLVTVVDFDKASDTLDLSNLAGARDVLTNTELANISAAASLEAALDLAASYTTDGAGDYSIFNYGGDAYVLVSGAAAGATLADADGLIKITGFSVTDITASNFVA